MQVYKSHVLHQLSIVSTVKLVQWKRKVQRINASKKGTRQTIIRYMCVKSVYLHKLEIKIINFLYNKWIDSGTSKFTALDPSLCPFIASVSLKTRPPRRYSEP